MQAVLRRYQGLWGFSLELRPFFLGGVMQGSGNKPPATLPQKAAHMPHDLRRNGPSSPLPSSRCTEEWTAAAALFDVPLLDLPTNFFAETANGVPAVARSIIAAQRLLCAAQSCGEPPRREELLVECLPGFSDAMLLDLCWSITRAVHMDPVP